MKHDSKGHRMSNLTDEQLIKAVEVCEDKSASDIAHHMGYDRSTISRHLKQLEQDGIVTHRDVRGAGGMLALWSVVDGVKCWVIKFHVGDSEEKTGASFPTKARATEIADKLNSKHQDNLYWIEAIT